MKLNFLFVIALFFSITLVVAQPPQIFETTGQPGYLLASVEPPLTIPINTTYGIHIHVINQTNSMAVNTSITCYFHVINISGEELFDGQLIKESADYFSYGANISGGNFTMPGLYNALVECVDASKGAGITRMIIQVTKTGHILTTPGAILYGIIDFLIFSFLCLTLYFGIVLPFRNERNNLGKITNINWLKYLKIFCWAMFYFLLVVFTWIAWNLIYAYSDWQSLGIILKYFFFLELALALPIFLGIVIIGSINWISDRKIGEDLSKFGEAD